MLFKYVPICISMGQNVRAVPFEQFGSGPYERHLCVIILNLGKNLRRCCLKVFINFSFGWPFCSANRNCLGNFSRALYEDYLCAFILNLDQWLRRRYRLKIFYFRSGGQFVHQSGTV